MVNGLSISLSGKVSLFFFIDMLDLGIVNRVSMLAPPDNRPSLREPPRISMDRVALGASMVEVRLSGGPSGCVTLRHAFLGQKRQTRASRVSRWSVCTDN